MSGDTDVRGFKRPRYAGPPGFSAIPSGFAACATFSVSQMWRVLANVCAPLIVIIGLLTACAPLEPQRPPEVRAVTTEADKPIAAPCFTEAERPVLKPATPIDIDHATADQIGYALKADALNELNYTKEVDALFLKCLKTGGTK